MQFFSDDEDTIDIPLIKEKVTYASEVQFIEKFQVEKKGGIKYIYNWEIGEEIGQGSFSKSKICKKDKDVCCLKFYNKIVLENQRKFVYETREWSNNQKKVQDEIDIWSRCNNTYIPQIYAIFEKSDWHKLYILNELGNQGEPGQFDYDDRNFHIKEETYNLFKEKLASERDIFLETVDALENNKESLEQIPDENSMDFNIKEIPKNYFNPNLNIFACQTPFLKLDDKGKIDRTNFLPEISLIDRQFVIGRVFFDMCLANYYLHHLGIAHRDVKLSNFVIKHNPESKELKVMMIDFNSGAFFNMDSLFLTFEGTIHFAPPEGLDSIEEGYSPIQYDIWSLGVCLYCMYHCKLPFDLDSEEDMYGYEIKMNMKILKDKVDFKDTPEPLKTLLKGMLIKDWKNRWTWDKIWKSELFKKIGLSVSVGVFENNEIKEEKI